jgi:hypothetical protein
VVVGSALNLVNSAARLELACGAVRVDTLRYTTSASDSFAVRFASGKVSSLKPSRLATRHKVEAWCLSASTAAKATAGEPVATPGTIFGGCGE